MANIRGWYDGYCIVNSKLKMYNIYSIVNYLESLELKNYWVKTGYIKNLDEVFAKNKIKRQRNAY